MVFLPLARSMSVNKSVASLEIQSDRAPRRVHMTLSDMVENEMDALVVQGEIQPTQTVERSERDLLSGQPL